MRFIVSLFLPLLSCANMVHLFNSERFDGSNPAVLTQLTKEGMQGVFQIEKNSFAQSFFQTQTSKIETFEVKANFYEVRGDWSFQASINEALSGVQSDPRDSSIEKVGIFREDLQASIAKIMGNQLSVGVSYKLQEYGTYTANEYNFLSAHANLWLAGFNHQLYGGATYDLTDTEVVSMVSGIEINHSNYTTLAWRPFIGTGIASNFVPGIVMELSSRFYPRQYTPGTDLASNFMAQYWHNQAQISTRIETFTLYALINIDTEDANEGVVVNSAMADKLIRRYELQVKKEIEGKDVLFFASYETATQENQEDTLLQLGVSVNLSFNH